jgi:hypothetical protein
MPYFALGRLRPVFDLRQQLWLDPDRRLFMMVRASSSTVSTRALAMMVTSAMPWSNRSLLAELSSRLVGMAALRAQERIDLEVRRLRDLTRAAVC